MAWGGNTNPVAIGDPTKKSHYDDLWDKLQYVRTDVVPASGKMLQGASTAWQGWTKDTATWTDDSMIVFTTGAIGSGGSDSPSAAHAHSMQSHTHSMQSHTHTLADGGLQAGGSDGTVVIKSGGLLYSGGSGSNQQASNTTGGPSTANTDGPSTANTGNHTPKYQKVIAATKDTYT